MGTPLLSRRAARRPRRALAAFALAASAAFGCQPAPTGPGILEEGPLRIRPVLVSTLDPAKLDLDSVAVVIRRSADQTVVREAVLAFQEDAILAWMLGLDELPDVLDVDVQVRSGTVPMFEGALAGIDVEEAAGVSSGPVHDVMVEFVGPGHDAASVEVDPGNPVLPFGQTLRFQATVRDARGAVIPDAILEWESNAPALAQVDDEGDLTAPRVRGSVQVTARTGNGVSGSADVRFQALVSVLTVVAGDGAEAAVAEAVTVTVQVLGEDGLGVGDVDVAFAAPAGASVADALVTTDSEGLASTLATLGTLPGTYRFTASVAGPPPASIEIDAHPGPPAALVVDLDGSSAEPTAPLAPGVRVRVVDTYGNPTASTSMIDIELGANPTGALLTGTTQVAASAGTATFTDLVLDRHGNGYTLVASASGLSSGTSAPFAVVQIPRSVEVTPSEREVHALGGLGAAFAALARDLAGAPIVGQTFVWSSSDTGVATVDANGSATAIANGSAQVRARAGTVTGSALVLVEQRADRVEVTPPSKQLASIGEQVSLAASVVDANGFAMAGEPVTWTSSADAVVTVGAGGVATAVQNGSARIEATAGSMTGSATITVQQVAASVTVTPLTGSLTALQQQLELEAEARDANGFLVADAAFAWSSENGTVASVDGDGRVTALANGAATLRATSGSASGSASVSVAQAVAAVTVDPPASTLAALAGTVQLEASAVDANGYAVAGATFTWSSDAEAVASVDASGLVTAETNGPATITVQSGGFGASAEVLVQQVAAGVSVTPASVVLQALHVTQDLDATVVDANGFEVVGQAVTWSVPAGAVASVDAAGLVKALANGSTVVTATAGSASGTANVTVLQRVATIELTVECASFTPPQGVSGPALSVPPSSCDVLTSFGDQAQVIADARDANGFAVAGATIEWTSSAPQFAPVDENGLVIAIGNGATTIRAEIGDVVAEVDIVVRQEVVSLTIEPNQLDLDVGEQGQLTAMPKDANGFLVEDAVISWSATGVASVDGSGLVTALAPGSCQVTATHLGLTAHAWVTVY
jgi:uncharacterized protein YjdB